MSLYHVEIYNEPEFITKYPTLNQQIEGMFSSVGIDKDQYEFSQYLAWSDNGEADLNYYNKTNENISIMFEVKDNGDGTYSIETDWEEED